MIQVIGEIFSEEDNIIIVQARIVTNAEGLDLTVYKNALALLRKE
jgi:hypothetical protein